MFASRQCMELKLTCCGLGVEKVMYSEDSLTPHQVRKKTWLEAVGGEQRCVSLDTESG